MWGGGGSAGALRKEVVGLDAIGLDGAAREKPERGISGSTVKIVAVVTMLIDHVGAVILERMLIAQGMLGLGGMDEQAMARWMEQHGALLAGYYALRLVGRLGFPIFCFLLVEGFGRTRDVKKYALRLGLFALISEIPFNLAISGEYFDTGHQNVFFTLLIGLLALCAFRLIENWEQKGTLAVLRMALIVTGVVSAVAGLLICLPLQNGNGITALCILAVVVVTLLVYGLKKGLRRVQTICACLTALGLFMILAELLRTDYGGMGVLTISAIYLFRKHKLAAITAGCVVLTVMSVIEITSFFALIPVALYNGKRGLKMKYFFYAFYPAHLLLLYLAAVLLGLESFALP